MTWLLRHLIEELGIKNSASQAYNFWSGFGSCLPFLAGAGALWHHMNCHEQGCLRPGFHRHPETRFPLCGKHRA